MTNYKTEWANENVRKCGCCGSGWFDNSIDESPTNYVACPFHSIDKPNPHVNLEEALAFWRELGIIK